MPLRTIPPPDEDLHAGAVRRLRAARRHAEAVSGAACATPPARDADARQSRAHADVAMLEEWLNWLEHGVSRHPEADGDWGHGAADPA